MLLAVKMSSLVTTWTLAEKTEGKTELNIISWRSNKLNLLLWFMVPVRILASWSQSTRQIESLTCARWKFLQIILSWTWCSSSLDHLWLFHLSKYQITDLAPVWVTYFPGRLCIMFTSSKESKDCHRVLCVIHVNYEDRHSQQTLLSTGWNPLVSTRLIIELVNQPSPQPFIRALKRNCFIMLIHKVSIDFQR